MPNYRKKWRQFHSVMSAARLWESNEMGPRTIVAMLVAIVGTFGTYFATKYYANVEVLLAVLPVLACVIFLVLRLALVNIPSTWYEVLDRRLAAYEPVNRESYRSLHQHTLQNNNRLGLTAVQKWLEIEEAEIFVKAGWNKSPSDQFSRKKI